MHTRTQRFAAVFFVAASMSTLFLPLTADAKVKKVVKKVKYYHISVSAIPGADEHTTISNPTTRCLTADMKALHASTVRQMEADIAKRGEGHATAVKTYRDNIAAVWSAMEQPYCGFGSRGLAAVKKSYLKSVDHIRSKFLSSVAG